jgi:hypothetical protein
LLETKHLENRIEAAAFSCIPQPNTPSVTSKLEGIYRKEISCYPILNSNGFTPS